MKQFKKLKRVWALMLALVMMLSVLPAEASWAADKYELKRVGAKEGVMFLADFEGLWLNVIVCKNGKDVSNKVKSQVKWKSSDKSVAKVFDQNYGRAVVWGVNPGTATITASYKDKSCSFKVTVKGPTFTVGGTGKSKGYVPAGHTLEMSVRGRDWDYPQKTGTIHYSSSNSTVAKVVSDVRGDKVIKGLKEGTATITAKSKLGTLKCTVTVLPALKLKVKKAKNLKKKGTNIGFSCEVVNKSEKPITIFESAVDMGYGSLCSSLICKIKGRSVTIKPGESKEVIVLYGEEDYNALSETVDYSVKYAGHKFVVPYQFHESKSKGFRALSMGTLSGFHNAMEVYQEFPEGF